MTKESELPERDMKETCREVLSSLTKGSGDVALLIGEVKSVAILCGYCVNVGVRSVLFIYFAGMFFVLICYAWAVLRQRVVKMLITCIAITNLLSFISISIIIIVIINMIFFVCFWILTQHFFHGMDNIGKCVFSLCYCYISLDFT